MQRLKDKSVVVTGAASGIGRAMAQVFAQEGARVLLVDIDEPALIQVVGALEQAGTTASSVVADVGDWSSMQRMARVAQETHGGIDVLLSNAGIFPSVRIEDMSEQDWDKVHAVNLKGAFLAVKACLPHMKQQQRGRVVLTSSITGPVTGYAGWAHYGATKAGMLGFMRTAALELAPHNITINAIMPGNIKTGGLEDIGEEYLQQMREAIPLGKLGEPEDVAYAALFLASDEAKYITGQTLIVDGGQILPESLMALA